MPGGQTYVTVFKVSIKTSLPATFLSTNDVVNFLNSFGQGNWNAFLNDFFTVSTWLQYGVDVKSSQITNALWVNDDGKATLTYTLTVTSDPVTASQINAGIWLMIGALAIAIGAVLLLIPVGGWAVDLVGFILAAAGVLTILDVGVVEVNQFVQSPAGTLLVAGVGIALIAGVGLLVYGVATSATARENVRQTAEYVTSKAKEYTPKVASAAGKAAKKAYSVAQEYTPKVASAAKSAAKKVYNYAQQYV